MAEACGTVGVVAGASTGGLAAAAVALDTGAAGIAGTEREGAGVFESEAGGIGPSAKSIIVRFSLSFLKAQLSLQTN